MGETAAVILTKNGKADANQETALEALRARLSQPGAKLLLHLHGGLIDETAGKAIAKRLSEPGDNSWNLDEDWTQLYVVWRTGALETLRTNWIDLVHDDRIYQTILRKLLRFVGERLGIPTTGGARSAATSVFALDEEEIQRRITGQGDRRDPFGEIEPHLAPAAEPGARATVDAAVSDAQLARDFEEELGSDRRFQAAIADLDGVVNAGLPGRTALPASNAARGTKAHAHLSEKIQAQINTIAAPPTPGAARGPVSTGLIIVKHAGQIAFRVFKRFRTRRDHGFHATVVEEICRELYGDLVGAKVWGMMVKDAADHFAPGGFGTELLELLAKLPEHRFAVTAHSAGSIWASQMLLAMARNEQRAKVRLMLLAPAVRQDLFVEAIKAAGDKIACARMLTMTDELERADAVLGHDKGYIYPSSLLYLVSGMFEEQNAAGYVDAPLVGMLRFAGAPWLDDAEAANAQLISHFFSQPENGIVTSPSEGVCMANCHGCFDDEPLTLKSVAGLL